MKGRLGHLAGESLVSRDAEAGGDPHRSPGHPPWPCVPGCWVGFQGDFALSVPFPPRRGEEGSKQH